MSRKKLPARASLARNTLPPASPRMLTLAAALLVLPASAWSDPTEITAVTFPGETSTTATIEGDVVLGGTVDLDYIGGANGVIVRKATTDFTYNSETETLTGASNGNTVNVKGAVTVTVSDEAKYYTVIGGATVNQEGVSSGNTVNVTVDSGNTVIGNDNKGSVVGGVGATLGALDPPISINATGNTVNLTAGESNSITVNKDVIGGLSTHGDATGNAVNIHGATAGVVINDSVYGGSADSHNATTGDASEGNAHNNTVTIDGKVTITGIVSGGATYHGHADANEVDYNSNSADSTVKWIIGGRVAVGDATSNVVTIAGNGTIDEVTGGSAGGDTAEETGNAAGNSVTIGGNVTINKMTYGGVTSYGNATGNTVTINGGTVKDGIAGGVVTGEGNATDNHLVIKASALGGKESTNQIVAGGESNNGDISGNTVSITGDAETGTTNDKYITVFGAYTWNATSASEIESTISGNRVTITDTAFTHASSYLKGGGTDLRHTDSTVNVSGNSVVLSGKSYVGKIYGGEVTTGGTTGAGGDATNNSVSINTTHAFTNGQKIVVTGGWTSAGNANGNTVTLARQGVFGAVTGGRATGSADGNVVTVTGTAPGEGGEYALKIDSVTGGTTTGASDNTGSASENVVDIGNAVVSGAIIGGSGKTLAQGNRVTIVDAKVGVVTAGKTLDGDVIDNHVTIRNSTITGDVYAGVTGTEAADKATGNSVTLDNVTIDATAGEISIAAANITAGSATGEATGNTVTLTGEIGLTGSNAVNLTGVNITGATPANDAYTGNTLEVRDYKAAEGSAAFGEISGFETYNFHFENVPLGSDPVLSAGEITLDNGKTGDALQNAKVNLTLAGAAATLKQGDTVQLFDDSDDIIAGADAAVLTITQGAVLKYTGTLGNDGAIEITDVGATPGSKALAEGALAGLALLTQGGDLAADKGIAAATRSAANGDLVGFGAVGGGSLRYDTGSHVDVDGYSLLAGLSYGVGLSAGKLALGAFFEYGSGDFNTSNSLPGGKLKGSGDTEYLGGGLLARFDHAGGEAGHFYTEGSLRFGKAETEFSSRALNARYDIEGGYFGVHLGAGYVWKLSDRANLDLYGKYLWSHQKGDNVRLSSGDPVKFDDVDSHRLRIGARIDWQATDRVSPYAGLAYEHEFDGEAKATAHGYPIEAPDLKGSTGIGELGVSFRAGQYVTLEAGAQAYAGKRDGVTGSLKLKIEF